MSSNFEVRRLISLLLCVNWSISVTATDSSNSMMRDSSIVLLQQRFLFLLLTAKGYSWCLRSQLMPKTNKTLPRTTFQINWLFCVLWVWLHLGPRENRASTMTKGAKWGLIDTHFLPVSNNKSLLTPYFDGNLKGNLHSVLGFQDKCYVTHEKIQRTDEHWRRNASRVT